MRKAIIKVISIAIVSLCINSFSFIGISFTNCEAIETGASIYDVQGKRNQNNILFNRISTSSQAVLNSGSVNAEKIAYLTFDDGPSHNTIKILETLKQYNIKGTFFVNGKNDEFSRNIYKRIVNEGHSLGNHTYSHDYSTVYKSEESYIKDTNKLEDFLQEVTGVRPKIVRFPGGSNNQICWKYSDKNFMLKLTNRIKKEGYEYFDWNVSSADSAAATVPKDKIVENILEGSKNKKKVIILMHDSKLKTTSAEGLPEIIEGLKKMGFRFEILSKDSCVIQFR